MAPRVPWSPVGSSFALTPLSQMLRDGDEQYYRDQERAALRDHIAIAVMKSLIRAGHTGSHEWVATVAHEQADAMLSARAPKPPKEQP